MKKRLGWLTLLMMILVLMTSGIAMAGTTRSPSKDIWCLATTGSPCVNGYGVQTISANVSGACSPGAVGFIGWDLSSVTNTIGSAQLTLTTYNVSGAPVPPATVVFQLYNPGIHNWTEVDSQLSPGSLGATLATTTVPLADNTSPQTVVFGGSANPADALTLGAYFESLKASGSATVGIRISGGCPFNVAIAFNDRENSGNLPGGAAATEPDLLLFTPTAVSLSSLNASNENAATNVITLLVIGTLGITVMVTTYVGLPVLRKRKRRE